jgi:uncharacterized membrane protein YqgA involved in biofilm formation
LHPSPSSGLIPVVPGTIFNVAAVIAGCLLGILSRKEPAADTQRAIKFFLGIFILWTGLKLCWTGLNGSFMQILGQLGLTIIALSLGHATGGLLRIQIGLNHLGTFARHILTPSQTPAKPGSTSQTFLACSVVFALNPLGIYGSILEGVQGTWEVLAIKAVMDGLSALAFSRTLGWTVLLSTLPILALQGTITLLSQSLALHALSPAMINSITATGGMLVFSVCLIVFPIKKIRLADYLPAFLYAPLLAALLS